MGVRAGCNRNACLQLRADAVSMWYARLVGVGVGAPLLAVAASRSLGGYNITGTMMNVMCLHWNKSRGGQQVRVLGGQVRGDRVGVRGNHIWSSAAVQPLSELGDGPR